MKKPLLLIDIDGVVNVFGNLGNTLISFEQEFQALGRYSIKIPQGMQQRLQKLQQEFACTWCSTWEDKAFSEIGSKLGLNPWPFIKMPLQAENKTYKLSAVQQYVSQEPFAWIDDDLHSDAFEWAKHRNQNGLPTLLLQTKTNQGMTQDHLQKLQEWKTSLL